MIRNIAVGGCLILYIASLSGCGTDSPVAAGGGGSTETTNGVTVAGIVHDEHGAKDSGAVIRVRSLTYAPDYDADSSCDAVACIDIIVDHDGAFSFFAPDSFPDELLAVVSGSGGAVAAREISLASVGDTLDLGTIQLAAPGALEGVLTAGEPSADMRVAVRGTELWSNVAPDGSFRIEGAPAGEFVLYCVEHGAEDSAGVDYPAVIEASKVRVIEDTLAVADLSRDLLVWWGFERRQGDTIRADTGRGSLLAPDISFAPGRFGAGLAFEAPGAIATALSPIELPRAGTVSLWCHASRLDSGAVYRLLSSSSSAFEITIRDRRVVNELFAADIDFLIDSTTRLSADRWYHLVCTWNAHTGEQRIYIDGRLAARGAAADDPAGAVTLYLGNGVLRNHEHPFQGRLDEVRLYAAELRPHAIRALAAGARR
jgi:hypothetical protein